MHTGMDPRVLICKCVRVARAGNIGALGPIHVPLWNARKMWRREQIILKKSVSFSLSFFFKDKKTIFSYIFSMKLGLLKMLFRAWWLAA